MGGTRLSDTGSRWDHLEPRVTCTRLSYTIPTAETSVLSSHPTMAFATAGSLIR